MNVQLRHVFFVSSLLQSVRPFHPAVIAFEVSMEQNIYRSGFSVLDEETTATVTTEKPV